MKKALSIVLILAMILAMGVPALAADNAPKVTEETVAWPVVKGSEEPPANEAAYFRYTPADFHFRGNSTPVLFVLGDGPWTEETANEALTRGGFDQMAQDEDGHVVFVSPVNGNTWTADDYAVMQALATNVTDDYTYELDLKGEYDDGIGEDGRLFAGRFRSYTFAEGSAQAFVKEYLDTPDASYWVAQWNNTVNGFGAGFHYADSFTRDDNLTAWEALRRINRISMADGVTYLDRYHVYSDYGVSESRNHFTTKAGRDVEYYQYVPAGVDLAGKSGKYPLVLALHGGGQHPEGYVQLSNWPVVAARENFIVVAINAHYMLEESDILELLDELAAQYPIDTSRVYSTGYSMGGVTSWGLGFHYPERFAAIAPTEAVPGGSGEFPYTEAPSQIIPTFFIGGESEFLPVFPKDSPNAIEILSLLSQANGFAYDGVYDAAKEPFYGMDFDHTYVYDKRPSASLGECVWTIHDLKSADGAVYTKLSSVSAMGHSAYPPAAEHIWQFFERFSRNADGSIRIHEAAERITEQTVAWPVVKDDEAAAVNTASFFHYVPAGFRFRGNSTPVLFVLGDAPWTRETAADALTRGGFDQMAQDEWGHVVFVSPVNGKTWTADDYAVMQALATHITDDYQAAEELQGLYDTGFAADGRMLAGRFRSYTFAEGSAQGFVKEYLDADGAGYWVQQWNNAVDQFGAGFHYAGSFTREDNLAAWEELRRDNLLSMMDGVSYRDYYSVHADHGIDETLRTFTPSTGSTFEYYQYIPETVDATGSSGTYPLVFVFHGSGQHPDGYIHLTDWPVTASRYGFFTVAVNGNQTNADLLELLDWLCRTYPVDESRVYATGYSMGGMKSWSLGFEHTERFAAIAPTEAIPGMGNSAIPFEKPDQALPAFWIVGEGEFFNLFPMNTPHAVDLIALLSETNGFDYNGRYDESLGKYFGMEADRTYAYNRAPGWHDGAGVWTIHEMDGADGAPSTLISSISLLGHSAYLPESERVWRFFSHYSRAAGGESVYTAAPCGDVKAGAWYASAVAHALDNGLMAPVSSVSFAPGQALDGVGLTAALYALAGAPQTENAAAWAEAMGLPHAAAALTREEVCQAAYDLAAALGGDVSARDSLSAFPDAAGASEALAWAVVAGLVNGRPGGLLEPDGAVTRAEAAVFFLRLGQLLAG